MDPKGLRGSEVVFDIESGITTTEDPTRGVKQQQQLLNRVLRGFSSADRVVRGVEPVSIGNVLVTGVDMPTENGEPERKFGCEDNVHVVGKKMGDERPKRKKACQKAAKPPRPPMAPSVDLADQKLVREISELAMVKQARRMKALKKIRKAKASSSSNTNLCALAITILFCLVIVWQGLCSGSHSNLRFGGSTESSVGNSGLISGQNSGNVSPRANGSTSAYPDIVEAGSGFDLNGPGDNSRTAG